MPRPPARAVIAATLSAATLLTASACDSIAGLGRPASATRANASAASPTTPATPAAAPTLTESQARAALISESDLGEPWVATEGFATWRESMLKASTESADAECGQLLDALYAEELLGPDATTRASVALDDLVDEAQLRYQVVAHRPDAVDRTLAWLGRMPDECGEFTARAGGGPMAVEVTEAEVPEVGDARQGLRVVLSAVSEYEDAPVLTLHVAAVRVGDDAVVLTNGGLGDVPGDATVAAVELGAHRLTEVQKQGRAEI
ncbi:hypothetical protein ACM01_37215 [Streptomyces viridochromogenes]|uniref:Lipoprotein n=1 Tax=Streptomyces viridochromogenes TaxID=1938 RepID=A0A0J7Z0T2_STRVR|nr:hypothetical protein [Streptomyces viridochromogenes]KMS68918.1 hypothetical protein ACM01_37215 [Streptomyces viridochromogenes]KOG11421.1 hypothetical protein ADK36_36930 [Streptomyces viridochromogenes]KOG11973.1 hypothetical protein ADK35_35285 [Streptomyces viridochromogenes]